MELRPIASATDFGGDHAAQVAAWERVFSGLLSEVLTQRELAGHFGVGRNKIVGLLTRIAGAEKFAGGWRVPIAKLPPSYWLARGLDPRRAA